MAKKVQNQGEIGERISIFFKQKDLTVGEVARGAGVSSSMVSQAKAGTSAPGAGLLAYLATIGADVNWLLTGAVAPVSADATLRVVAANWADLADDDQVRLAAEVRRLAEGRRAKKSKRRSIS